MMLGSARPEKKKKKKKARVGATANCRARSSTTEGEFTSSTQRQITPGSGLLALSLSPSSVKPKRARRAD